MSISDVLLQNLMPKNFLDSSDDENEAWTTSSGSSNQSCESSGGLRASKGQPNYHVFEDYFGLSNLLQNVQITDDNPFFYQSQCSKNDLLFRTRSRRLSWESDASDPMAVISPTLDAPSYSYSGLIGDYSVIQPPTAPDTTANHQSFDGGFKQLPPPSMRLSKAVRDQIINGSFQSNQQQQPTQQHFMNRRDDLNHIHSQTAISQPIQPHRSQTSHLNASQVSPINSNTTTNNSLVVGQSLLPARSVSQSQQVCVFCRNNGESEAVYSSHVLKDCEGRTACPILRAYTCPICKANGDNSHTIKYCPLNQHNNVSNHHASAMATRGSNPGNNIGMPPPPNAGMMPPPPPLSNHHQQQQQLNNTNNLLRNTMPGNTNSCHSRVVRPPFSSNGITTNNNNMMQRMKQR